MVQTSHPGVYLQEKASGVKTITGVSTSITSFIGRATKGKMNKAIRCFSFADFTRNFGPPHPSSDVAISVRQFFDNGGTDCYVVRVAKLPSDPSTAFASLSLKNYQPVDVLHVSAKSEGTWGAGVRLEVDYNTPTPDDTFTLRVFLEDAGVVVASEVFANLSMDPASPRFVPAFVTQSSDLISVKVASGLADPSDYEAAALPAGFSQSGRKLDGGGIDALVAAGKFRFEISVDGSPYAAVDLSGAEPLDDAKIKAKIDSALQNFVGVPKAKVEFLDDKLLRLTADSGKKSAVRVRRAASNDIAEALMLGVEQGGIEVTRWSWLRPQATGTLLVAGPDKSDPVKFVGLHDTGSLPDLAQDDFNNQKLTIDGRDLVLTGFVSAAGKKWLDNKAGASPATSDSDGLREKLRKIAALVNGNAQLGYRAQAFGAHLSLVPAGGDITRKAAVASSVANLKLLDSAQAPADTAWRSNVRQYALTGGSDGEAPDLVAYEGDQAEQTGLYALDPVDLFNLMVVPADADVPAATREDIYARASIYCQQRRAFLLIDSPDGWTRNGLADVVQDTSQINSLRAKVVKDYSAVFYPRIVFNDRGLVRAGGASGALAGLFARTDATRGVWKAPAGVEADLRGISGFEVRLTDRQNGVLNKLGVNCLRNFPSGSVSWGARTLDGMDDNPSEWKYIPIRRLALFLQESLYRGTQWAVFHPNDEPLWAKLRLNISAFMMNLYRQGAFQGSSPSEAFFVKCDSETTTQNDRNLGIVNVEVGFAPLKPAEFVVITIQQMDLA